MALTSLDTNGLSPVNDHIPKTSSLNNHKRSLDSSEQNLTKRRHTKSIPSNSPHLLIDLSLMSFFSDCYSTELLYILSEEYSTLYRLSNN